MMKKYLWTLALSTLLLAACGKKEEPPVAVLAVNTEEKVLNIYNWPEIGRASCRERVCVPV